jgi:magnesium transporter
MKKIKYNKVRKVHVTTQSYSGAHTQIPSDLQLFVYDENDVLEIKAGNNHEEVITHLNYQKNNWINLHGLNDLELIKEIGTHFNLENFIISDIVNTSRRTLLDEVDDLIFISIKSILPTSNHNGTIQIEQISFILKDNTLLSFQERKGDFFTHIRERIRTNTGIIRRKKTDYLLYLMLDAVMENFFITIETIEDIIEKLFKLLKKLKNNEKIVIL